MALVYGTSFEADPIDAKPVGWTNVGGVFNVYYWADRGQTAINGLKGAFSSDSGAGGLYSTIPESASGTSVIQFRINSMDPATMRHWAAVIRSNVGMLQHLKAALQPNGDGSKLRLRIQHYNSGHADLSASNEYNMVAGPSDLLNLEVIPVGSGVEARVWIQGTPRPGAIVGSGTSGASWATAVAANVPGLATGFVGVQLQGPHGSYYGLDSFVTTDGQGGEDLYYGAVQTDATAPAMVGSLTSSGISPTGFTVTWNAATDNVAVTEYQTSENAGVDWQTAGTNLFKAFTGKAASTAYPVQVRARDAAGNTSTPLSITVTTSATVDSTSPNLSGSITPGAITDTSVTYSWPAATDNVAVTGYETSINGGAYVKRGMTLSRTDPGLNASTGYPVSVRAYDAADNKSAALNATLTTTATPPTGGTVTIVEVRSTTTLFANVAGHTINVLNHATMQSIKEFTNRSTNAQGDIVLGPDPALIPGAVVAIAFRNVAGHLAIEQYTVT